MSTATHTQDPDNTQDKPTDYQALLLGLAKSPNPEAELINILNPKKAEDKTQPWQNTLAPALNPKDNQTAVGTSIRTIFRLAGIVQGTLQSEILSRTEKLSRTEPSESEDPNILRRELQEKSNASTLVSALQPRKPNRDPIQNWEATSRAMSISDLKQRTIVRAAFAAESIFQAAEATPETKQELEDGIKLFREISRNFEISLAAKNNTQAGPGKAAIQARNIPTKGLEIISCLTQISIECLRNSTQELTEEQSQSLRNFQSEAKRAFGNAYGASQSTDTRQRESAVRINSLLENPLVTEKSPIAQIRTQWENWQTAEKESLATENTKILGALFSEVSLNPENEALLQDTMEKASLTQFQEEETLEKEWITVRHLENLYKKMEKTLKDAYPEEAPSCQTLIDKNTTLPLRIFAAFQRENASLGKASVMVLIGKILSTKKNQQIFQSQEEKNPLATLEPFGFVQETNQLQTEAGRTLQSAGYGPHEKNQLEELSQLTTNLDYAESILYSRSVITTLHSQKRVSAELASKKIMAGEQPQTKLENDIKTIFDKASDTIRILEEEIQNFQTNTEILPKLLRDQEAAQTLNGAIARLIHTAETSRPGLEEIINNEDLSEPVKNAARTMILIADRTGDENGRKTEELKDITKRISAGTVAPQETLGRLIANLTEGRGHDGTPSNLEEVAKIILLQNFEEPETPISLEEAKALITQESKKVGQEKLTPFSKIKTPELAEVVRLTNNPIATNQLRLRVQTRFLRDIGTIRRWRERTTGMDQKDSKALAIGLCKTSPTLKRACESQILRNIEACCQPPAWNDHASMSPEETRTNLGNVHQSGTILMAAFKKEKNPSTTERELFGLLQKLQTLTEEIQGKSDSKWVRTEELAIALTEQTGELRKLQLQTVKKISQLPGQSTMIEPSLDLLQAWGNYTGNREAILKTAILLPKEKKSKDRVNTANYLAATIEAHGTNLKELHGYMKAVVENPEALAETLIQHEHNINKQEDSPNQNNWETAMLTKIEEAKNTATSLEGEIEEMTNIFEAKIQEAKNMEDSISKEEFLDPRFHRAFDSLINQKERELQRTLLKENRLRKLIHLSKPTQDKEKGQTFQEEDLTKPEESTENSIAHALDLALTANKQKLILPKKIERSQDLETNEILDAARTHQKISHCQEILQETAQQLREYNPKAQDILEQSESKGNLLELCQNLKEALFESVKSCEILQIQGQKGNIENPALTNLKNRMLAENPELETEQRKWRASLTGAATQIEKALAEADPTQETNPKNQKRIKQKPELAHSLE